MALRRLEGFVRYAIFVQYHGSSFLGFAQQKKQEDCILPDGTDLRGFRSIEGRLRDAFEVFVGQERYENIQVSSRTDRGVHALKNTFHVDILHEHEKDIIGFPEMLRRALGYHLSRQETLRGIKKNEPSLPGANNNFLILSWVTNGQDIQLIKNCEFYLRQRLQISW